MRAWETRVLSCKLEKRPSLSLRSLSLSRRLSRRLKLSLALTLSLSLSFRPALSLRLRLRPSLTCTMAYEMHAVSCRSEKVLARDVK
mgnify:CR=1 FL=1